MSANRLGELLVRNALISDDQLEKAIAEQKKEGIRLGAALIKLGYVEENDLASFLSKHYGGDGLHRIGEVPPYAVDVLCRRAEPPNTGLPSTAQAPAG